MGVGSISLNSRFDDGCGLKAAQNPRRGAGELRASEEFPGGVERMSPWPSSWTRAHQLACGFPLPTKPASSPPPSAQLPFESWPTPPLVLHNLRYDVNQGRRIGNCSQANRSRICLIPGSLPCHHGELYPGVCVGNLLLLAPSFPRKSCVSLGNPYPAGGGKFKQLGSSAQIPTLLEFAILYTEVLSNWSPTSSISVTW